ncbi:MAG: LPD38 domain-containing protein, partial [Casimicrobiaceae bacterium]
MRQAAEAFSDVAGVHVVDTVEQLREQLADPDIDDLAEGFYEAADGSVYLVADAMGSLERAKEVFVHEVFGHLAMERSPDMAAALRMVQSMHAIKSRNVMSLWNEVARRQRGLSPTDHAKEVIALMAERGVKNSAIDRVIAAARALLRKIGLVSKYSDAELRALIAGAGRKLVRDAAAAKLSAADKTKVMAIAGDVVAAEQAEEGRDVAGLRLASMRAGDALGDLSPATSEEDPPSAAIDGRLYSKRAPMGAAASAARKKVFAEATEEDKSARDKLRDGVAKVKAFDSLEARQGIFDFAASIEKYEKELNGGKLLDAAKSAYKQVLSTQNLASVMSSVMQSGVPVWENGVYKVKQGRKGLAAIFAPLSSNKAGNLVAHFELYAAARRGSRLINETNPDGTSKEKLMSRADIAAGLELGKQYPELVKVFDEWQVFNGQALDMMQDAGLIDAESRALWERNDYVPFYRAMEDLAGNQGPGKQKGVTGQKSGVRTLTGRDAQLGNIIENMMLNVAHSVDASFKNRAAQSVAAMLDGVAMTKLPLDWQPVKVTNAQMVSALRKAGIEMDIDATAEQKAAYSKLFRRVAPAGPNIVTVMQKGLPVYYEVADPLLLRSLTAMGGNPALRQLDLFGLVTGAKRLLTHAVTAHPHFIIANFIRDTLATWVQSPLKIGVLTGAFKGFRDVMKNDPDFQAIMAAGGGGGAIYDTDPKSIRTLLARKLPENQVNGFLSTIVSPKKLWTFYRQVQVAAENANRLRVYRATKANGGSDAEAAYQARDVLNFSMRGDHVAVQALTMSVPFLNARLQGLYRLQRGYKQNRAAFLLRGGMLMAATLALMFVNHDDERYEELQEWDRDAYWHTWIGDQHWRIPKPFEVGSLFG